MPIPCPLGSLIIPVRQGRARPTPSALARHSSAVVLLPVLPTTQDWRALPHGELLRELYRRKPRKAGDILQLRVGRRAETLLSAALLAAETGTFERLQAAGKLARCALEGDPSSLLLWQQGLEAGSAAAAGLCATVAALQAATFSLATFKSRPSARHRLTRIDLTLSGKLSDL